MLANTSLEKTLLPSWYTHSESVHLPGKSSAHPEAAMQKVDLKGREVREQGEEPRYLNLTKLPYT